MRADEIEIPKPCPIDLRELVANAGEQFHCHHCDRSVHVLSHMSEDAVAQVLERRQRDNLCVAFLRSTTGEVAFRKPPVVPSSRLRRSAELLRFSALALGVAACSPGDELGRLLDSSGGGEEHGVVGGPPPAREDMPEKAEEPCDPNAVDSHGGEDYEVLGGAPPMPEIVEPVRGQLADANETAPSPADLRVDIDDLVSRSTPLPRMDRLLETRAAREQPSIALTVAHCVDVDGRVVDAELVHGDKEVGALLLREMKRWRYRPYEVDGRAVRVCTEQKIILRFDLTMERLPS